MNKYLFIGGPEDGQSIEVNDNVDCITMTDVDDNSPWNYNPRYVRRRYDGNEFFALMGLFDEQIRDLFNGHKECGNVKAKA